MVNYIRFNRIEHKTTFIERVRMCFDKKFALEYQIFELNNELEYAKQEHHYDRYKELIIELIAIERTRYRFKDIIDILLYNKLPLNKVRGNTFYFENIPIIVTFSPAYLLRNNEAKRLAWQDLQFAFKIRNSIN